MSIAKGLAQNAIAAKVRLVVLEHLVIEGHNCDFEFKICYFWSFHIYCDFSIFKWINYNQ
jgi:hypothetical protein